jgi:hypothetical protein
LDLDATDDPVHGDQEGKFFHGYYRSCCYLPLYVTCGGHVLVVRLRTSDRGAAQGSTEVLASLVQRIRRWMHFYSQRRKHQALKKRTPDTLYYEKLNAEARASA